MKTLREEMSPMRLCLNERNLDSYVWYRANSNSFLTDGS